MADVEFRSKEVMTPGNDKIAAVISGLGGKIEQCDPAIETLVQGEYDVVAYEYDDAVLTAGHAEFVPQLMDDIGAHFAERAEGYSYKRYVGGSWGFAIGLNLQRADHDNALPGLFAAGGVDTARVIAHNPIFLPVRRAYSRNGWDETSLREYWGPLHASPESDFVVVLGALDHLIHYREAMNRFRQWDQNGTNLAVETLWLSGHRGAINFLNNNIVHMNWLARQISHEQ